MTSTVSTRTIIIGNIVQYLFYCVRFISIIISLPIYTFWIVVFGSYRILIWIFVKLWFSNKLQLMSQLDTCFINCSNTTVQGGFLSVVTSMSVLKGNMNLEQFQAAVARSYLQVNPEEKNDFALTRTPRQIFGVWFWKVSNNPLDFDMRNHITTIDGFTEMDINTVLTDDKIMEWISTNFRRSFENDKPHWHMYFVPHFGYKEQENVTSAEHLWAFVLRFHHCYADGMHGMQNILMRLADVTPVMISPPIPQYNLIQKILKTIWAFGYVPVLCKYKIFKQNNPLHGPDLNGTKMCFWSESIHVDVFRNIKQLTNASVTAITTAAVSETLSKYLFQKMPNSDVKKVLLTLPVPTKHIESNDKLLGNHVTATYISLPVGKMPILKRLGKINDSVINHRRKTLLKFTELMLYLQGMIPFQIQQRLLPKESYFTICYSNMPGPNQDPIHVLGGHTYVDLTGWLAAGNNIGFGVAVTSVSGRCRLSLAVDTAIIPTRKDGQDFLDSWLNNIYKIQAEALNYHQAIAASQMIAVEVE